MAQNASESLVGSERRMSEVDGHVGVFANSVEEVTAAMGELLSLELERSISKLSDESVLSHMIALKARRETAT